MVQKGEAKLLCNEDCEAFKAKQKKLLSEEDEMKKREELKAQQEELEWFERKQQGKKRRPRKQKEDIIEPSWFQRHCFTIVMLLGAAALMAGLLLIAVD